MIFFNYSSRDRERVRPIRDALVAPGWGFEVFWDQQVPPGIDWDTWLRQHLAKADCVVTFWSTASIVSSNVRHEAVIAKQQAKLIPVLLEPIRVELFPLGLWDSSAANLSGWNGDFGHEQWRKLINEIQLKVMPPWVRSRMDELEAQLVGERARREIAERSETLYITQGANEDFNLERDRIYEEARQRQQFNKVFICYRRDDSAGSAGRVKDRLELEFGQDLLFMDVDAIPLGVNYVKTLRQEVAKCDVLLAVIGPNWLELRDEKGNRRLDDPNDFVHIEIGTALQRDIFVIPVLVDGAKLPKAEQLPSDLQELTFRNGLEVRHSSFRFDMDKLIRGLKGRSD